MGTECVTEDACYDRGAPLFFLLGFLNFGAQDQSKKMIRGKIKLLERTIKNLIS